MGMEFNFKSQRGREMQEFFNALGKKAFTYSHWELAEASGRDVNDWREFLSDPQVAQYIRSEMDAIATSESHKMIIDISTKSKSTGTAQTLLALDKTRGATQKKVGPVFVYCAIPLNEREQNAPNVEILTQDPFKIPRS